jgi:hypothetical protein
LLKFQQNFESISLQSRLSKSLVQQLHQWIRAEEITGTNLNLDDFNPAFSQLIRSGTQLCQFKGEHTQVCYQSAIAHQLIKLCKQPLPEITNQLSTAFTKMQSQVQNQESPTFTPSPLSCFWQSLSLKTAASGWIRLMISDVGLSAWLQFCAQTLPTSKLAFKQHQNNSLDGSKNFLQNVRRLTVDFADSLFKSQYTHARCCSLLQLAHKEGIITLKSPQPTQSLWIGEIAAPARIPWLTSNQKLRLQYPEERQLLLCIIALIDALDHPTKSAIYGWRFAVKLVSAFENFHQTCRIFGEVKAVHPELAQVRLGLVSFTQICLQMVLQDLLRLTAPVEL